MQTAPSPLHLTLSQRSSSSLLVCDDVISVNKYNGFVVMAMGRAKM